MPVQETSRDAYNTADLPRRQRQVFDALTAHGPSTDLELVRYTMLPINVICGARNALVALGLAENSGQTRTSPYGKQNIVWRLPAFVASQVAAAKAQAQTDLRIVLKDTRQLQLAI